MLVLVIALQVIALLVRGVKLGTGSTALIATSVGLSLAAATATLALPPIALDRIRALARALVRTPPRAGLFVFAAAVAVLGSNVYLQQPDAWDERGILGAARLIAAGGPGGLAHAYRDNAWLGPQHPPLGPLVYACAWRLGATTPTALRWLSVLVASGALLAAWRVLSRFLEGPTAVVATALLLTSPLVVRVGSAVGNDGLLLLLFWLALVCGLRLVEAPSKGRAAVLGLVLLLGALTKYTMIFIAPLLPILPWATGRRWPRPTHLAITVSIAASSAGWLLAMDHLGILERQVSTLAGIASTSAHAWRWAAISVLVSLPSAAGIYSVPVLLQGLAHLRPRRARGEAWLAVWILAVALPVSLTLPTNRFFLPAFPAISAISALGLERGFASDDRVRAALLLGSFCAVTLLYYASADLRIPMNRF